MAKKDGNKKKRNEENEDLSFMDAINKASEETGKKPATLIKEFLRQHTDGQENLDGVQYLTDIEYLLEEAFNSDDSEEIIELAHEVLQRDSENIPAMIILADELDDQNEGLEWLLKAEAIAAEQLDDEHYDLYEGEFSNFHEGIIYLTTAFKLAHKLTVVGHYQEAMDIMEELMELDDEDNIHVRDLLAPLYAATRKFNAYERLLKKFDDEPSTAILFNHALYTAMKYGVGLKAKHALNKAMEFNPYAYGFLQENIDEEAFEEDEEAVEEAVDYMRNTLHLWFINVDTGKWIAQTMMDEDMFEGYLG